MDVDYVMEDMSYVYMGTRNFPATEREMLSGLQIETAIFLDLMPAIKKVDVA